MQNNIDLKVLKKMLKNLIEDSSDKELLCHLFEVISEKSVEDKSLLALSVHEKRMLIEAVKESENSDDLISNEYVMQMMRNGKRDKVVKNSSKRS